MRKSVVLLLVIVLASVVANIGCGTAGDSKNVAPSPATGVVAYGQDVFYFSGTQAEFGNSLSHFLEENPDLEVSAMAGDDTAMYGVTRGYFVTFRQKLPMSKE